MEGASGEARRIQRELQPPMPNRQNHQLYFMYKRQGHNTNLNDMRLNGEMCDVIITVNDKEFRAHKVVLASGLRYFRTLFSANFREGNQDRIAMNNVDELSMEALLNLAYTGEIHLDDDDEQVLSLLEDVDFLNEGSVKEACVNYLSRCTRQDLVIQVFLFARNTFNIPLTVSMRQKILFDFAEFSFSREFIDLDFPSIREILSLDKVYHSEPRVFFERIIQWICHDINNRQEHLRHLLALICMVELTADYLISYLYANFEPENDAIIRSVMSYWRECKDSQMPRRNPRISSTLLITIDRAMLNHIQIYDFATKTWSLRYAPMSHKHDTVSEVCKNFLVTVGGRTDEHCVAQFSIYNHGTNTFHEWLDSTPSMAVARRDCAVIGTSWNLFVCGGRGNDDSALADVECFSLKNKSWSTLPPMRMARYNAVGVSLQGCLYVMGGKSGNAQAGEALDVVEKYDPEYGEWTVIEPMQHSRASFAATVLNGKVYVCGGWDNNSVEVYDPSTRSWQPCANMRKMRDSFVLVAHDGKLMAVGGDNDRSNPTTEIYEPLRNMWELEETRGLHGRYLSGGLIREKYE